MVDAVNTMANKVGIVPALPELEVWLGEDSQRNEKLEKYMTSAMTHMLSDTKGKMQEKYLPW